MPHWSLVLVVVTVYAQATATRRGSKVVHKIPDFLHVCNRNNPQLNACIEHAIEELKPHLKRGIVEMGVPPMEPLLIKELVAAEGSGLKVTSQNLKVFGCSNFTINRLHVHVNNHSFEFGLDLPHLVLDGKYVIDGRIILIPIKGSGDMAGDIYNAKADVSLVGGLVRRHGEDYLHYRRMDISIKVGSGKLRFDNLFGGDKVLGDVINTAINLNFDQFIDELRPIIEKALAAFMLDTANTIVEGFPYRILFPIN